MIGNGRRVLVCMEVKGGKDRSNIHNRLGEAEKSHIKTKKLGCTDLWTLLGVNLPEEVARERSPTTTLFFYIDDIMNTKTAGAEQFRNHLISIFGLPIFEHR